MRGITNKTIMSDRLRFKTIAEDDVNELESMINEWLSTNHVEIVSIEFKMKPFDDPEAFFHRAYILYKDI